MQSVTAADARMYTNAGEQVDYRGPVSADLRLHAADERAVLGTHSAISIRQAAEGFSSASIAARPAPIRLTLRARPRRRNSRKERLNFQHWFPRNVRGINPGNTHDLLNAPRGRSRAWPPAETRVAEALDHCRLRSYRCIV